jgi:hypothetical protein
MSVAIGVPTYLNLGGNLFMAITSLRLKFGLSYQEVYQTVEAAGGDDQACDEVAECWDMVQIWRDWFTNRFGEIKEVRHRSYGQDPPDLELVSLHQTAGMENTHLLPEHLGQYNALRRKGNGFTSVPPISQKPANFSELREAMDWTKDNWVNVENEWQEFRALLASQLLRKMGGIPKGGIIGMVTHDIHIFNGDQPQMAKIAYEIINHVKFPDFTNYSLILLARTGPARFHSSLIRRREKILEQQST